VDARCVLTSVSACRPPIRFDSRSKETFLQNTPLFAEHPFAELSGDSVRQPFARRSSGRRIRGGCTARSERDRRVVGDFCRLVGDLRRRMPDPLAGAGLIKPIASQGVPSPFPGLPLLPTRHRHRHRLDLPYATYSFCPPWALRCRGRPLRPDFGQRLPPANPFRLAIERNIFAEHPFAELSGDFCRLVGDLRRRMPDPLAGAGRCHLLEWNFLFDCVDCVIEQLLPFLRRPLLFLQVAPGHFLNDQG